MAKKVEKREDKGAIAKDLKKVPQETVESVKGGMTKKERIERRLANKR